MRKSSPFEPMNLKKLHALFDRSYLFEMPSRSMAWPGETLAVMSVIWFKIFIGSRPQVAHKTLLGDRQGILLARAELTTPWGISHGNINLHVHFFS
jgi:hypothetical protein